MTKISYRYVIIFCRNVFNNNLHVNIMIRRFVQKILKIKIKRRRAEKRLTNLGIFVSYLSGNCFANDNNNFRRICEF
jgi:hypothetical protein